MYSRKQLPLKHPRKQMDQYRAAPPRIGPNAVKTSTWSLSSAFREALTPSKRQVRPKSMALCRLGLEPTWGAFPRLEGHSWSLTLPCFSWVRHPRTCPRRVSYACDIQITRSAIDTARLFSGPQKPLALRRPRESIP